jgi:hypothetical protein
MSRRKTTLTAAVKPHMSEFLPFAVVFAEMKMLLLSRGFI